MTGVQLAIDWSDLCDPGADQLHQPADPPPIDLRGQGLTAAQVARMTDVEIVGDLL